MDMKMNMMVVMIYAQEALRLVVIPSRKYSFIFTISYNIGSKAPNEGRKKKNLTLSRRFSLKSRWLKNQLDFIC